MRPFRPTHWYGLLCGVRECNGVEIVITIQRIESVGGPDYAELVDTEFKSVVHADGIKYLSTKTPNVLYNELF